MGNKIPLVVTQDRELNQYQQNVQQALAPILGKQFAFGSQLISVALISGDTPVETGLGHNLTGWFPVRIRGVAATLFDKYDTQDASAYPKDKFIVINSSAAVTVDLWVY